MRKAEERAETLEGYLIALANLDEFIRIIRGSANREEARVKLLAFEFTRKQVEKIGHSHPQRSAPGRRALRLQRTSGESILDLRLYQLTGLESDKIETEYKELIETIKDLLRYPRERIARLGDHQERAARDSAKNTRRRA